MAETLVDVKGMLFVKMAEPDWERPVLRETFYPTGIELRWHLDLIGEPVTYTASGIYRAATGVRICLEFFGDTKPIAELTVETPIAAPKRAKKTRYTSGRWEVWNRTCRLEGGLTQ